MKEEKAKKPNLPLLEASEAVLEELLSAGVHFGHKTQRWHPSMREYIYTSRDGIHIIDLIKTIEMLNQAIEAAYEYATKGEILIVGTKHQVRELVQNAAIESKSHFVNNRWAGGLLTNYLVTRKSIKKLNDYIKAFREGIENRTKKELVKMKEELGRLDALYGGVKMFNKRPAAVIVIDPKKSRIAVKEANKMNIPVIALTDTNASTEGITHIIPANDDAISSVEFILKKLVEAIKLGNKGVGPEFIPVDYAEVDDSIQNMAKKLEEKKMASKSGVDSSSKGGPRVIRVSREQAKKFVKQNKK
jgi:small subunit ribosomal protein S2